MAQSDDTQGDAILPRDRMSRDNHSVRLSQEVTAARQMMDGVTKKATDRQKAKKQRRGSR